MKDLHTGRPEGTVVSTTLFFGLLGVYLTLTLANEDSLIFLHTYNIDRVTITYESSVSS